jgi:hypothetical protein
MNNGTKGFRRPLSGRRVAALVLLFGAVACTRHADPGVAAKTAALSRARQRGYDVQQVAVHKRPWNYVLGDGEKDFVHVDLTLRDGSIFHFTVQRESPHRWRVSDEVQYYRTLDEACIAASGPRTVVRYVETSLLHRGPCGRLSDYVGQLADGSGVRLEVFETSSGLYVVDGDVNRLSPAEVQMALAPPE